MTNEPLDWCDAHHATHWADGGATAITNCVLVCKFHHKVLHHTDWAVRIAADGLPEFVPPKWIDEHQRPRRNKYHHRN